MSLTALTSEDTLLGDKEYLDGPHLPFPSHHKTPGRKRAFLATSAFVFILFLASYLTIQYRASDAFGVDLKPIPFKPEDVQVEVDHLPNVTYPIASRYSGVRGPPTPLFRGGRLMAPATAHISLTQI